MRRGNVRTIRLSQFPEARYLLEHVFWFPVQQSFRIIGNLTSPGNLQTIPGYFISSCRQTCENFPSVGSGRDGASHATGALAFLLFLNRTLCACLSALNAVFLPSVFPPLLYKIFFFFFLLFALSFSSSLALLLFFCAFSTFTPPFWLFASSPRYNCLLDKAEERRRHLLQRYNEFLLAYEAGDMLDWIREKKAENTGMRLDDVWELQKKFDEFERVRMMNPHL